MVEEKEYSGDEEFSRMTAAMDQGQESVKLLAPVVWSYFESLLETGFTRKEALVLVSLFQDKLLPNNKS